MWYEALPLQVKNRSQWIIMTVMYHHHQFMLMFLQQLHTFTPMITRSLIVNQLQFSLHSHEHASIHKEKRNLEYKKGCSDSNSSTTDISSNNADNSLHATSSEYSTLANRMYEFPQQMKVTTGNGLQLATERPKEKLIQMFDKLQKEHDEKLGEMHDNIAQFLKMHEAGKHKANQLQKNIISENDDMRDNIPFLPTAIGSDVSKPYQQDTKLSNDNIKSLSLNEKLDANQSIVSTSSTSDCSQSEEVLAATLYLLRLIVANQLRILYSYTPTLIVLNQIIL